MKCESSIKQIPYPVENVYARLSDLTNLAVIRDRFEDPAIQAQIPADKQEQVRDVISRMEFTTDTVSAPAAPLGTIGVRIIDRDPLKCVKFASEQSPVGFTLWVQTLPVTSATSKMRVTLEADLNFFMKQMVGSKLKDGVEKLADMLAMIPYN